MNIAKCDSKGRIYLKETYRARYGESFIILATPDELVLLPLSSDPLKELEDIGRDIPIRSIRKLRDRIHARARREVRP
jgi:hypothetical protein